MKFSKLFLSFVILLTVSFSPLTSFAQDDDSVTGEEFVQTLIDFGISMKVDHTVSNVFGSNPDKLRAVLEAVADERVTARINDAGARGLSTLCEDYKADGLLELDMEELYFPLSNIYDRVGQEFAFTPELAQLLLERAYGVEPEVEMVSVQQLEDERLEAERKDAVAKRQSRNRILVGSVLVGFIILISRVVKRNK